MTRRQWLEVLEAAARAHEANARVMRMLLEYELGDPPNVVRDADKTGPRTPYNSAVALENLKRVYDDSRSAVEKNRVRKIAEQLAAQGHLTDADIATFTRR